MLRIRWSRCGSNTRGLEVDSHFCPVNRHSEFLIQYPKQPDDAARVALASQFGFLSGERVWWENATFGIRSGTDLSRFHFRGVSFDKVRLTDCIGAGAIFEQCVFEQRNIEASPGHEVSWEGVEFRGCKFDGTTFGPATLSLRRASFEGSSLRRVNFRTGRLAEARFDRCQLNDCAFRSAALTDASFRQADLRKVSLELAVLDGVDFAGALFHQMDFYGPIDLTVCRGWPANV
jgi:uncharacterized protein YjbI with pentapeptide repeats